MSRYGPVLSQKPPSETSESVNMSDRAYERTPTASRDRRRNGSHQWTRGVRFSALRTGLSTAASGEQCSWRCWPALRSTLSNRGGGDSSASMLVIVGSHRRRRTREKRSGSNAPTTRAGAQVAAVLPAEHRKRTATSRPRANQRPNLSSAEIAAVLAAVEHGCVDLDYPNVGPVVALALQAIAAPPSMPLRAATATALFASSNGRLVVVS